MTLKLAPLAIASFLACCALGALACTPKPIDVDLGHGGCSDSSQCPASDVCSANSQCTAKGAGQCHDTSDCPNSFCDPVTNMCLDFSGAGGGAPVSTSSAATMGTGGAGGATSACAPAPGTCGAPGQCSPWIAVGAVSEDPPVAAGGSIADGTYVSTASTYYAGKGNPAPAGGSLRFTMTFAAGQAALDFDVTLDGTTDTSLLASGPYALSNGVLTVDLACPQSSSGESYAYTAKGDTLLLIEDGQEGDAVVTTLVRQP